MKTQSTDCYQDSAQVLTTRARIALLKGASADWEAAQSTAKEAGALEIKALNLLRRAGMKLQEAAGGRDRITFEFLRQFKANLPESLTFNAVKFCVQLCRSFDGEIKTLDEARAARRALFEAFTLESTPRRTEPQRAHECNPWNDFVSSASSFTSLFKKLEVGSMAEWSRDKLSTFARETKPIAEKHAEAVKLLG
jgi:hypothetical protein